MKESNNCRCLNKEELVKELRNLFINSFADSANFFDCFIENFYLNNVYYKVLDNHVISAFYLNYKKVKFLDKVISIPYILGASTSEKYRNKGFFKEIFNDYLKESNDPFCLLSPDVFGFYERLGFDTILYRNENEDKMVETSIETIEKIYQNLVKDMDIYLVPNFLKKDKLWQASKIKYYKNEKETLYQIENEEYSCLNKNNGIPYIMGRIVNEKSFYELTGSRSFTKFINKYNYIFTDRC